MSVTGGDVGRRRRRAGVGRVGSVGGRDAGVPGGPAAAGWASAGSSSWPAGRRCRPARAVWRRPAGAGDGGGGDRWGRRRRWRRSPPSTQGWHGGAARRFLLAAAAPGRQHHDRGDGAPTRGAPQHQPGAGGTAGLDEGLQALQVPPPQRLEHQRGADDVAEPAAEEPREVQLLLPREQRAAVDGRLQREPAVARRPGRCARRRSTAPSIHSVTSMRSVRRSGPTRVSTAMRVPTPRRCGPSNRMASASAIQSTWRSIGSTHGPHLRRRGVDHDRDVDVAHARACAVPARPPAAAPGPRARAA